MAVQTIIRNTVNLEEPVVKKILRDTLGSQDNQAHRFEVEVKRGNEAVDLTGAVVSGYFIRAGGETVLMTGGVEDGAAFVVLNDSCYIVPGRFSFAMKVQIGNVRHTVLWYEGSVGQTSTDILVDPENIIPSLDELLAQIEFAEQAASRANTAAESAEQATINANEATGSALEATQRANAAAQSAEQGAERIANLTATANTLEPGSEATASYDGSVLTIGVPKGEKGDKGEKGEKGDTGPASPITVNNISAIGNNITLTAKDVGALPDSYAPPVESVNGKTGAVTLTADDVGALPDDYSAPVTSVNGQTGDVTLQTPNPLDNWPVGSVYWSSKSTSPASLFGGTWTQIKDRFILAAGSTYGNGATGGAASNSHYHTFDTRIDSFEHEKGWGFAITKGGDTFGWNSQLRSTHSNTINTMPPYVVKYCWERTA